MDKRIFGLENEYGVTCTFRGQRRLSPDEVARYLFRRVVHWGRSSNVFLENGARLYLDVGSHPEYATPECDGVTELIWEGVSSATTRSRPIINTRDEPHADAERFRRLHVIVGDSNMSEFTTFLKIGVTDLVVRMVEENTVMRDLTLENPIRAIREISHDISCKKRVRLATGRELSAVDIQTEYFTRAQRFAERRGLDALSKKILAEWEFALKALTDGAPERLETKVDWVAKYVLIERYRAKHE